MLQNQKTETFTPKCHHSICPAPPPGPASHTGLCPGALAQAAEDVGQHGGHPAAARAAGRELRIRQL